MTSARWSFYDLATGKVADLVITSDAAAAELNAPTGHAPIAGPLDPLSQRVDVATGAVVDWQPPAPPDDASQTWAWDAEARRWVSRPTIAAQRAAAWELIKAERGRRLSSTFSCAGRVYQIDRDNVPGAALDALRAQLASEPWSIDWTLADNSVVTLNSSQMIEMAMAMRQAISDLWAASEQLRSQIEAATTPEQLAAIAWPARP